MSINYRLSVASLLTLLGSVILWNMKKVVVLLASIALLLLGVVGSRGSYAADRYAVCDNCGFCISPTPATGGAIPYDPPTQNMLNCRKCLYEGASGDLDTLKIDETTNQPPTPHPQRHFTMLGCLSTDAEDFTKSGAASGVTQALLNVIFSISGGIAFLYLIYGAFLVLTSQGDPGRLNQGKRTIWGAVIGVIFTVGAVFLVNLIGRGVLQIPGFGS